MEEQEPPAEPPAQQVRVPPLRDHRPPAPEPELVDQELVPHQPATAAAPHAPPQEVMRRTNRGARQIPWRDHGHMYYAPTRRTAHLFRNCSGLASVPDAKILQVQICRYCNDNWPAGVPMTKELRSIWAHFDALRTPFICLTTA